ADQVMGADRSAAVARAQGLQALRNRSLVGEMHHDQLRLARIVVFRGHPGGDGIARRQRCTGGECHERDAGEEPWRSAHVVLAESFAYQLSSHRVIIPFSPRRCPAKYGATRDLYIMMR